MTATPAPVSSDVKAAPDSAAITLGGNAYTIRPLTLRQLKVVLPAFTAVQRGDNPVAAGISIIHAALLRDHPLSLDAIEDMETTMEEVTAAVRAIAELAGLVPKGEAKAGTETANP